MVYFGSGTVDLGAQWRRGGTVIFEPTDLERLSTFLFNLESSGPKLRILDVRWDLRPDKENPYVPGKDPGYLIGAPTVKIGLRKPLTKESSR